MLVFHHTYSAYTYFCFKIVISVAFNRIALVKEIGECNTALNGRVSVIILFLYFQNIQVLV